MEEGQVTQQEDTSRWAIDFDWYKQNNRSFAAMAGKYLCPACAKKDGPEKAPAARVLSIGKCCATSPGFFSHRLPIMDAVFRVFLSNGNKPLTIEELRKELVGHLGGDTYRTAPETLAKLLRSDRHYGIREAE